MHIGWWMQQKVKINWKLNQHLVYYIRRIMFAGHDANHATNSLWCRTNVDRRWNGRFHVSLLFILQIKKISTKNRIEYRMIYHRINEIRAPVDFFYVMCLINAFILLKQCQLQHAKETRNAVCDSAASWQSIKLARPPQYKLDTCVAKWNVSSGPMLFSHVPSFRKYFLIRLSLYASCNW